jgi:serine/threonine-protein kinase
VLLFEALTGKVPFGGLSPIEIILKHVHEPVPPIVTPAGLEPIPELMCQVVEKCLAKSPMDRFQSMDEVLSALQEIAAPIHTPTVELPASHPALPIALRGEPGLRGRHPALLLLGFLIAVAGGIGGTALVMRSQNEERAPLKLEQPVVEAPRPLPPPPAPALTRVEVHVESEPSGAEVSVAGKVLGLTPLDYEQRLEGEEPIELTLSKPAYAVKVVTLAPTGPRVTVSERLSLVPPKVEPIAQEKHPENLRREPQRTTAETRARQNTAPEKRSEEKAARRASAEAKKAALPPAPQERPASKLDEDDDVTPPAPVPPPPSELKRPPSFHPSK